MGPCHKWLAIHFIILIWYNDKNFKFDVASTEIQNLLSLFLNLCMGIGILIWISLQLLAISLMTIKFNCDCGRLTVTG